MEKTIGFASFPDFSGNSKALYEDMSNCKCNLVWFCKDRNIADRLKQKGINAVWEKDDIFQEEFKKVNILINTHDDYLDLKQDNQIFINLWHGLGPKKGGVLLENEIDWNYKFCTKNDYLIAPSEFGRFIYSTTFNMPFYKVKQFPQARYKWLFENKGKDNLEKVLNTNIKKFNKIIMYAPTFKQGLGRKETQVNDNNILNLNNYEEEELVKFLEQNNYLLLLKLHPSEERNIPEINTDNILVLKDENMLDNFITINEIMDGVDLLISDYSSIFIDFINLEKPVIFFDTDKRSYQKNRGVIFNNTDFWWSAGPKVHELSDFVIEVKDLLDNTNYYKDERHSFNQLVNGEKDKNNEELINFILNLENIQKENTNIYGQALFEKQNEQLKEKIEKLTQEKRQLRDELDSIIYSRTYKFSKKIAKILKK